MPNLWMFNSEKLAGSKKFFANMWIHTQSTVPLITSNTLFWFNIQITTNGRFNSIKLDIDFGKIINHQAKVCVTAFCCSCWVLNYLGDPLLITWIIIIVTDTDSCRLSLATMSRVFRDISFSQCEPHLTICHDIFCCTLPFECNAQRPPEKRKEKKKSNVIYESGTLNATFIYHCQGQMAGPLNL